MSPAGHYPAWSDRYAAEAGLSEEEAHGILDPVHPLGGTGEPDDIACGAVYLASDQAKWGTLLVWSS